MVKYPDIVSQLPQGLAAVPWWYEPEPDPEYQRWLQPLIAEHVPIFVAPGVNMWSEIAPDFNKSFRNIDTFLSAGKKAHALGLINTLWTDDQESLRRMAWPGIAYGAAAAWQSVPMTPDLFFDEFATLYYPIAVAPHIGQGLRHLSKAELALQSVEGANTMEALWTNPFGATDLNTFKSNQEALRQTRLLAESAEQCFSQASNLGADPELLESWKLASKLLDYAGMRGLYAAEIQDLWLKQQSEGGSDEELWSLISGSFSQTHGRIGDILDALSVLAPEYRKSWLLEYTPYRLGTAMVRWNREYQYWWQAERRYREFRSNYKKGTAFPPLATVIGEY